MSTQSEKISIDISKNYNVKKKAGEVIHQAAYEKLKEYVKDALLSNTASADIQEITDCRWHNTIFIGGERGSGKTTFLVNLDDALDDLKSKLFILKPIDPTIIDHGDNFILVIVGQINKEIEKRDNENRLDKDIDKKKKYYETLKDVAEAIESKQLINTNNDTGIDAVMSYQSSLDLEEKLHKFYYAVNQLLGTSLIVLRIDDVDMAFDSGFDILEVLRKYTASPYIMPIVTGDMVLYNTIISQEMYKKIKFKAYEKTHLYNGLKERTDKYRHILKKTTENIPVDLQDEYRIFIIDHVAKYIAKVFPFDRQINLQSSASKIFDDRYRFFFKFENISYTYKDIKAIEDGHHSLGFGSMEREDTVRTLPENIRLFFQYLAKKLPLYGDTSRLNRIGSFKFIDIASYKRMLRATAEFYQNQAEFKDIFLEVQTNLDAIDDNIFSVRKILHGAYFNPLQNEKLELNTEFNYSTPICVKNSIGDTNHDEIVNFLQNSNPKPKSIAGISNAGINQTLFFWNLFVHNNYNATEPQTNYLFIGKFVEMVFSSLSPDFNIQMANEILQGDPFFANISKTKNAAGENEELENIDEPLNVQSSDSSSDNQNEYPFLEPIINSSVNYGVYPARFLYAVLKKFFRNVNEYKKKFTTTSSTYENETFDIYIVRMSYMLLNAVAYFESDNDIPSKNNIALNSSLNLSVFSQNIKNSNAYTKNIKKMYDMRNSLTRLLHDNFIIKAIIGDTDGNLSPDSTSMFEIFKYIKISKSPKSTDTVTPPAKTKRTTKILKKRTIVQWVQEFLNSQHTTNIQKLMTEYKAQYANFQTLGRIVKNIKALLLDNPNVTYGLTTLMKSASIDTTNITEDNDKILNFIQKHAK